MWTLFKRAGTQERTLIVGLGNPGSRYENTRHNAGFAALAALREETGIHLGKKKHEALVGEGVISGKKVILAEPQTFMNNSGRSVRAMAQFYKIPTERIIVMVDDIDLPLGQLRVRIKGGAGTHNGMRSLLEHLGTGNFARIRIGVGKPPAGWDLADFVLAKLSGEERAVFDEATRRAAQAAKAIVSEGMESAMRQYNNAK